MFAGSYFGTHFIMGGERFESPQPGEYLFGENEDLNFLGNKPVPVRFTLFKVDVDFPNNNFCVYPLSLYFECTF